MPDITKMPPQSDHDLLIKVDTKVDRLIVDVKDLKDGLSHRIAQLENKMDVYEKNWTMLDTNRRVKEHDEMYNWMRGIKTLWGWLLAGAVGFGFLLSQLKTLLGLFRG